MADLPPLSLKVGDLLESLNTPIWESKATKTTVAANGSTRTTTDGWSITPLAVLLGALGISVFVGSAMAVVLARQAGSMADRAGAEAAQIIAAVKGKSVWAAGAQYLASRFG